MACESMVRRTRPKENVKSESRTRTKGSTMHRAILVLLSLMGAVLLAQHADADRLRDLIQAVPQLPVDRFELTVHPPLPLEEIAAVTADQQGNLYVLHRPANGNPVVVLDAQGTLLRSWGQGMFKIPHGIRIDPGGNVWTVDANTSMVYKFTPAGEKLLAISVGDVPDPCRAFCGATDVAFAQNGHVLVSDGYRNARVIEYDAGGRKVRAWGKHGSGPGEFQVVHAIAVGPQGHVYVADRENGRLQWFDPQGQCLGQWTYDGQLFTVAFSPAGELYVSTHLKGVSWDTAFTVLHIDPASGTMLGRLDVRAHELTIAPDGALLPATLSSQLLVFRLRN
jgi:DNA-binding beta-propeller fold protein YncE